MLTNSLSLPVLQTASFTLMLSPIPSWIEIPLISTVGSTTRGMGVQTKEHDSPNTRCRSVRRVSDSTRCDGMTKRSVLSHHGETSRTNSYDLALMLCLDCVTLAGAGVLGGLESVPTRPIIPRHLPCLTYSVEVSKKKKYWTSNEGQLVPKDRSSPVSSSFCYVLYFSQQ